MQIVVVAFQPFAGKMRDDGFGATEDELVIGRGELQVIIPDVAAPVLGACGFDEALGCSEGADGADGLEDEVGVFWEDVGCPGILFSLLVTFYEFLCTPAKKGASTYRGVDDCLCANIST